MQSSKQPSGQKQPLADLQNSSSITTNAQFQKDNFTFIEQVIISTKYPLPGEAIFINPICINFENDTYVYTLQAHLPVKDQLASNIPRDHQSTSSNSMSESQTTTAEQISGPISNVSHEQPAQTLGMPSSSNVSLNTSQRTAIIEPVEDNEQNQLEIEMLSDARASSFSANDVGEVVRDMTNYIEIRTVQQLEDLLSALSSASNQVVTAPTTGTVSSTSACVPYSPSTSGGEQMTSVHVADSEGGQQVFYFPTMSFDSLSTLAGDHMISRHIAGPQGNQNISFSPSVLSGSQMVHPNIVHEGFSSNDSVSKEKEFQYLQCKEAFPFVDMIISNKVNRKVVEEIEVMLFQLLDKILGKNLHNSCFSYQEMWQHFYIIIQMITKHVSSVGFKLHFKDDKLQLWPLVKIEHSTEPEPEGVYLSYMTCLETYVKARKTIDKSNGDPFEIIRKIANTPPKTTFGVANNLKFPRDLNG